MHAPGTFVYRYTDEPFLGHAKIFPVWGEFLTLALTRGQEKRLDKPNERCRHDWTEEDWVECLLKQDNKRAGAEDCAMPWQENPTNKR